MSTIEASVEVDVPVRTAYDQWTQFEDFPRFMEGVDRVEQLDDTRLHWEATIAGKHKEWDALITEQVPDQRIAWENYDGANNDGVVSFQPLDAAHTKVMLRMEVEPEGLVEKAGDMLGITERRVKADLERFKEFIESRGSETGAWRGEVHDGDVERGGATGGMTTAGTSGVGGYSMGNPSSMDSGEGNMPRRLT